MKFLSPQSPKPSVDRKLSVGGHDYVLPYAREIRFVRGRLIFEGAKHPAPFPSMIVVFGQSF